jgi:hypothetical protein
MVRNARTRAQRIYVYQSSNDFTSQQRIFQEHSDAEEECRTSVILREGELVAGMKMAREQPRYETKRSKVLQNDYRTYIPGDMSKGDVRL